MKLDIRRGIKFGAMSAAFFPAVLLINNYIRGDQTTCSEVVIGAVAAFVFFAGIGTLTDKVGSDVG